MPGPQFSPKIAPKGRRADARVRLGIPARLILLEGTRSCLLDDLSCAGARVRLANPPAPGTCGVLWVNRMEMFGTVVWAGADRVGFQFDERTPIEDVVSLRHFADDYAEHERRSLVHNARDFVQGRRSA